MFIADTGLRKLRSTVRSLHDFTTRLDIFYRLIHFLAFLLPIVLLYQLDPLSFEYTWKGRTYYLFFIFIKVMEMIYASSLREKPLSTPPSWMQLLSFTIVSIAPTLYIVIAYYGGINVWILTWSIQHDMKLAHWMALCVEYLALALLNVVFLLRWYGVMGLRDYSISSVFLAVIGVMYTIDNIYPFGYFTLFQAFVPSTVALAEKILHLFQYQTLIIPPYETGTIYLKVWNAEGSAMLGVAWPCAGIDSLILYTLTIALFLNKTGITRKQKLGYFLIGAIVTYLINVLRVVTIFQIAVSGGDFARFHDYYGPLYSFTWIISYLLIIVGSRLLWQRWRSPNKTT